MVCAHEGDVSARSEGGPWYCVQCGENVHEHWFPLGANFCPTCGVRVKKTAPLLETMMTSGRLDLMHDYRRHDRDGRGRLQVYHLKISRGMLSILLKELPSYRAVMHPWPHDTAPINDMVICDLVTRHE